MSKAKPMSPAVKERLKAHNAKKVRITDLSPVDFEVACDRLMDNPVSIPRGGCYVPGSSVGVYGCGYLRYLPGWVTAVLRRRLCHREAEVWAYDGFQRMKKPKVCFDRMALERILAFVLPGRNVRRYVAELWWPEWSGESVTPPGVVG
jgi:hypothetical protein